METLSMLFMGFQQVMDPFLLIMCFLGALLGTLVGVLPGFGSSAAIAVLLPVVYGRDPLASLVMLAGVFYGAMFGGMITSICMNIPGEGAAIVTTFDGYPMAKAGKAGKAMGIAAMASFFGGTFGVVLMCIMGVPLARSALAFGPPEYFTLYVLTFVAVITLNTNASALKSTISLFFGLIVCMVGIDSFSGTSRLTFGNLQLMAGIDFIPASVGLFGLSEVILSLTEPEEDRMISQTDQLTFWNVFPSIKEIICCIPSMIRGSLTGFIVGALPGSGATIATFLSYSIEKRVSKDPDSFGKGNMLGVAAPESANNGSATGSFVPLLSLGIPGSSSTAVLLGGFLLLGLTPGPRFFLERPDIAWGLIASMYVGNVMLLFINTAFIPLFIWLLKVSKKTLPVIIATLCVLGAYSVSNRISDILIMLIFGGIGVFFKKLSIPAAPAIIAIVLGWNLEFSLRQTLEFSKGDISVIFNRPVSIGILLLCLFLLVLQGRRSYKEFRAKRAARAV